MSEHRYPCTAEVPSLILANGEHSVSGHRHECMHDAGDDGYRLVEHQCRCGMTWRAARPAPDLSWITTEEPAPNFWADIRKAFTWRRR
jgi:hypothetical protein